MYKDIKLVHSVSFYRLREKGRQWPSVSPHFVKVPKNNNSTCKSLHFHIQVISIDMMMTRLMGLWEMCTKY